MLIDPEARVLVLSATEDVATIAACINAGATGFASKDGRPEDLLAAVLAVAQGHLSLDPSLAISVLNRIKTGATQRANIGDLSPREREVLALVAKGKANKDVAVILFIAASTVKTHLDRIYDKLGAPDRAAAVAIAKDRGLI